MLPQILGYYEKAKYYDYLYSHLKQYTSYFYKNIGLFWQNICYYVLKKTFIDQEIENWVIQLGYLTNEYLKWLNGL